MKHYLSNAKHIVIKIGSALLVDDNTGQIRSKWLETLISEIFQYWQQEKHILIVSSGAIPLGRRQLRLKKEALQLDVKQAAAAVGQIKLAHAYQEAFKPYGITAAQILLTLEDSENRKRYLNAKNTLEALLNLRVIPIINENDTVATAEIRFGDNDRLAARVAQMVGADTLVLLSDINGLYTDNPKTNPNAKLIPLIKEITPEILAMAGDSESKYGSGGMITKLAAAKIALTSGCKMVISAGNHFNPLSRIDKFNESTWFIPDITPRKARKNWIAQHLKPKGKIIVDHGASQALLQGKSLLSVGILNIEGDFQIGDAISIFNEENQVIGKGLTKYAFYDAVKIMGQRSSAYQEILGYCGHAEIIHRNDLVVYTGENN